MFVAAHYIRVSLDKGPMADEGSRDIVSRLTSALAGRYRVEREIGSGGMATVYLATDLRHSRVVAIKVLNREIAQAVGGDRFIREISITARLQHPHILTLIDSGEADGFLYYVMPYVEGESLRSKIARDGALPPSEASRLFREIVDALVHAHKQGMVHRDIKPDNVMISDRHALVVDFGVAKAMRDAGATHTLTTTGTSLGTPRLHGSRTGSGGSRYRWARGHAKDNRLSRHPTGYRLKGVGLLRRELGRISRRDHAGGRAPHQSGHSLRCWSGDGACATGKQTRSTSFRDYSSRCSC
jgi:serine/threonine protein kinase